MTSSTAELQQKIHDLEEDLEMEKVARKETLKINEAVNKQNKFYKTKVEEQQKLIKELQKNSTSNTVEVIFEKENNSEQEAKQQKIM